MASESAAPLKKRPAFAVEPTVELDWRQLYSLEEFGLFGQVSLLNLSSDLQMSAEWMPARSGLNRRSPVYAPDKLSFCI